MDKFKQLDMFIRDGKGNPKIHKRVLAASMVIEGGMMHEQASHILRPSPKTIATWATRFEEGGRGRPL